MNGGLRVPLPPEMEDYRDDLEYFFSTMVRKLHTNRHKGTSRDIPIGVLLQGAIGELNEIANARKHEGQFETAVEAADLANFGFLIARSSWHMTRQQFEEGRHDDMPIPHTLGGFQFDHKLGKHVLKPGSTTHGDT